MGQTWISLPLTCLLLATGTLGYFEGTCPRKDPSPGVLVLTPGQELVMTCRGHVKIDGLMVRNSSSRDASQSGVITKTGDFMDSFKQDANIANTSSGHEASPASPTLQPTSAHTLVTGEDEWKAGSRATRGENSSLQWKWTGRMVGKREREVKWSRGAAWSLPSVREADSGTFTCYHRGKERFSVKVIVADPPQKPQLLCYKKSPSSKIRCESEPQESVTIRPNCHLLLTKSPTDPFLPLQCSFSSRTSRCFCVLDHNEDEIRSVHFTYLCVTSIVGNTTSNLLDFTPMGILKPDAPTNVSVQKVEREETWMVVTWSLPSSWKSNDNFYDLIYQIKYRPALSSFQSKQIHNIKLKRTYLIKDAIPGVEYLIQVRTKEEYDGLWSNWSPAVTSCSWTAVKSTATTTSVYADIESSGIDINIVDVPPTFTTVPTELLVVSTHVLWISAFFVVLSVILAVFMFRQRDRFLSKVQSLSFVSTRGALSHPPPSVPAVPEGQALVTFAPASHREQPEDEHEGQNEKPEAMNFNNTSYFFVQPNEGE